MAELTDQDRRVLLKLARSTVAAKLAADSPAANSAAASPALAEKRGCFVTLHKKGMLRGCIGTIEPVESLLANVEENALNAAFRDPRFPPLKRDELPLVTFEVSVLSVPQVLDYDDAVDLLSKLKPGIHGVILERGWQRATFLPQVWQQLPDKKAFLENLCQKAGMARSAWKQGDLTVKIYQAEYFSEPD